MLGRAELAGGSEIAGRTAGWWLRLVVAIGSLSAAAAVAWHTFVDHALRVWNSPAALILLVMAIEFVWFVSHVPDGGVVAWLKIVLGACALLGALPDFKGWSAAWVEQSGPLVEPRQVLVAVLAAWVVADGVRDRRQNLRRTGSRSSVHDGTPPARIATSSRGSDG